MNFLQTLSGEFNYNDMEADFENDVISKGFTLFLLLGLMLFGTITLINLLVGVVISDVHKLHKDSLKRVWEKEEKVNPFISIFIF